MTTNLLTHSRIKAYRTCPRLHHFLYNLRIKPLADAPALRFGTLVHKALEAWWKAESDHRLEAGLAAVADHKDDVERAKARALVGAYHVKWSAERFEVVAVEKEFALPLVSLRTGMPVPGWLVAGKMDAVVRDPTGAVFVVEHKTSASDFSAGSVYAQQKRIDSQISIYLDGAASLGLDPEAVLYDVLKKPVAKPLKATPPEKQKRRKKDGILYAGQRERDETPEEYQARVIDEVAADLDGHFSRFPVPRLERDLEASRRDLHEWWKRIERDRVVEQPPGNPDACFRFGRPCEFWDVCTGAASLDNPHLFRRSRAHEELTHAAQNAAPEGVPA